MSLKYLTKKKANNTQKNKFNDKKQVATILLIEVKTCIIVFNIVLVV